MFFYSDKTDRSDFNFRLIGRLNPETMYRKHYDNMLFLQFVAKNTDDRVERYQANKEIPLCQKKLDYWGRSLEAYQIARICEELKKRWKGKRHDPNTKSPSGNK